MLSKVDDDEALTIYMRIAAESGRPRVQVRCVLFRLAHTFPRASNAFEVVGHPQRKNDGLLKQLLRILQVRDLVPRYRDASFDNVSLCVLRV